MTAPHPISTAPRRMTVSTMALVIANAVPIIGVIWFHWQVFPIILLYWLENVVVGGFNVLRMLVAEPGEPAAWIAKVFMIPFFCVHFGMFTLIHGMFVFDLFGKYAGLAPVHSSWLSASQVLAAIRVTHIEYAVAALLLSHGISFVHNYVMGGEYRTAGLTTLMSQPYSRVVILHLVVLGGGALVAALGSPVPALLVLVLLKTVVDLAAHRKERVKLGMPGTLGMSPGPRDSAVG